MHALVPITSEPGLSNQADELTLTDVARALRLSHLSRRSIINHLRRLADEEGLPLPRNPRFFGGKPMRYSQRIGAKSRWDARDFQPWLRAWKEDGAPLAAASTGAKPSKPTSLHEAMAARAAKIAGRSASR